MAGFDREIGILKEEIESRYHGKRLVVHINSVANFARESARKIDPGNERLAEKVYLAGLAHDLYKGYDEESLRRYITDEAVPVDRETLRMGRGLLHAPAAAHYLRTRLGVSDTEIYEAVYYHTTGHPGAGIVEKILFCSDYLEPHRPQRAKEPDTHLLGRRMVQDLEGVYREILGRKLAFTVHKGRALHPNGVAAWNEAVLNLPRNGKKREKS